MKGAFMSSGSHLQGTSEAVRTRSPIQRLGSVESQQEASKPGSFEGLTQKIKLNEKEPPVEPPKCLQWLPTLLH